MPFITSLTAYVLVNSIGCVAAFFNNATSGTECAQCPSNSMNDGFAARNCVCNDGTRLLSGVGSTTTFEPCSGTYYIV